MTAWLLNKLGLAVIWGCWLAFKDQYRKVSVLEERRRPKIAISGNKDIENCFVIGNDFFLRAKLQSLGEEPILNVEAHLKELCREGKAVPLGDLAQLMMHPGTPTLKALKHGVDGFIDVIKTENDRPILALAWQYVRPGSR
jgi:hypothetical protein